MFGAATANQTARATAREWLLETAARATAREWLLESARATAREWLWETARATAREWLEERARVAVRDGCCSCMIMSPRFGVLADRRSARSFPYVRAPGGCGITLVAPVGFRSTRRTNA
jgi:hypothetical protein